MCSPSLPDPTSLKGMHAQCIKRTGLATQQGEVEEDTKHGFNNLVLFRGMYHH